MIRSFTSFTTALTLLVQKLEYTCQWVNAMVADVLAPCTAWSSAAMILVMQVKWVLVFHEGGFQQPVPSQWWAMIENADVILQKWNQRYKS